MSKRREKCCREIEKVKCTFSVTLRITPFPDGYPVQSVLPLLETILHNAGITPRGEQYTLASDGSTLFSFVVSAKRVQRVYSLFGLSDFSNVPLTSVPALASLALLLPTGSDVPLVSYSVQSELFFIFCEAPTAEYRLHLLYVLSGIGTVGQFSVLGREGVATFLTTTVTPVSLTSKLMEGLSRRSRIPQQPTSRQIGRYF